MPDDPADDHQSQPLHGLVPSRQYKPVPDPSILTTEQLHREIMHLRELIEARLDNIERRADRVIVEGQKALETALTATDKAIDTALAASSKAIVELDSTTKSRIESVMAITDNKFIKYEVLLVSESEKVALARDAANQAVAKAEVFNEKRFDILTKQIEELKATDARNIGKSQGISTSWGLLVGVVGFAATFLTIIIIVMNMISSRTAVAG